MPKTFEPVWSVEQGAYVNDVAVSAEARRIVVGTAQGCYVMDAQGQPCWAKPGAASLAVAIAPDGSLVASGGPERLVVYDSAGREVWAVSAQPLPKGVALLAERGVVVFATADTVEYALMSGQGRSWRFAWPQMRSLAVAPAGHDGLIFAGTTEGEVLVLSEKGELLERLQPGGELVALAVAADSGTLAAADCLSNRLSCYDGEGELLWEEKQGARDNLLTLAACTAAGDLLVCDQGRGLVLLGRSGATLGQLPLGRIPTALALERGGNLLLVGDSSGQVRLWQAPQPVESSPSQQQLRQIRASYLADPSQGLCLWVRTFDEALADKRLAECESLLNEIEAGYELNPFERTCVKSRRGAWLIGCGNVHRQNGQTAEARACYEQALQLQIQAKDFHGQARARGLLEQLAANAAEPAPPLDWNAHLHLLGSAETLLTYRVEHGSLAERLQAVQSAARFGYLEPLLAGLAGVAVVANQAAAACAVLQPGPALEVLLQTARHENWFARWRAVSLLRQRASAEFFPVEQAETALLAETDPAVRRNWLRLLEEHGRWQSTSAILPLLRDPDADVRDAACRVLAHCDDARALTALRKTENGFAFFDGTWVRESAQEALEQVEERNPEPPLAAVEFLRSGAQRPVPTQCFPPDVAIAGRIRPWEGLGEVTLAESARLVDERTFRLDLRTSASATPAQLVEVLSDDEFGDEDTAMPELAFSLPPPAGGWPAGFHQLEIYFENELAANECFEVRAHAAIEEVTLFTTGLPLRAAQPAQNVPQILLAGADELRATVALAGFAGLQIEGRIFEDTAAETAEPVAGEGAAPALAVALARSADDTQQQVELCWPALSLSPGAYLVEVLSETGQRCQRRFRVVAAPVLVRAQLLPAPRPSVRVAQFQPDEEFSLAVELADAPANLPVTLEWRRGRRVHSLSVEHTRQSGATRFVFSAAQTATRWEAGEYQAVLRLHEQEAGVWRFKIRPLTWRQRLRQRQTQLAQAWRETSALLRAPDLWSMLRQWWLAWFILLVSHWLVRKAVGGGIVDSAWVLKLNAWLTARSWLWLAGGALSGVWLSRLRLRRRTESVRRLEISLHAVFFALLAHHAVYLVYSPGSFWPNVWGGFFGKLLYWRTVSAWATTGVFAIGCFTFESDDFDQLKRNCAGVLFSLGVIYLTGAATAFLWGTAFWAIVALFNKTWAQTVWAGSVPALFVMGVLSMLSNARKEAAK